MRRWKDHRRLRSVKYMRESYSNTPEHIMIYNSPKGYEYVDQRQFAAEQSQKPTTSSKTDSGRDSLRSSNVTL